MADPVFHVTRLSRRRPRPWLFIEERLAGYRDAHAAAGLTVDENLVLSSETMAGLSQELRPELMGLLQRRVNIDAVFCTVDMLAPSALRTLRRCGLRVPEDVSVVGFDDDLAALVVDPQLTTIRQPWRQMGSLAVELLLEAIAGKDLAHDRHRLPTQLVRRASS